MGKLWADTGDDELIHTYNCIVWGLKEEVYPLVREFDGIKYVVPVIESTRLFAYHTRPGMMDAKAAIESILAERGFHTIPHIELVMMSEEEADWCDLGWENYKLVKRMGLDVGEEWRFGK